MKTYSLRYLSITIILLIIVSLTYSIIPVEASTQETIDYDIYAPPLLRTYPYGFTRELPIPLNLKILVIPVHLADAPLPEDYLVKLNEWLEYVKDYWYDATKGNVRISFKVYPKPVLVPYRAEDIGDNTIIFLDFIPPVKEEFNTYMFVHASVPFEAGNKKGIWSQTIRFSPDDNRPSLVIVSLAGCRDTIVHEVGHLLGLEDLVDVYFSPMGVFIASEQFRARLLDREPLPTPYPTLPELWIAGLIDRKSSMTVVIPKTLEGEVETVLQPVALPSPKGIFIPFSYKVEDRGFNVTFHKASGFFVEVRFLEDRDEVIKEYEFDNPALGKVMGAFMVVYNYTMSVKYDSLGSPYEAKYDLVEESYGESKSLTKIRYLPLAVGNKVNIPINQTHSVIIEITGVDYVNMKVSVKVYVEVVRTAILGIMQETFIEPTNLLAYNKTFFIKLIPKDLNDLTREAYYDYYLLPIVVSFAKAGDYELEFYIDGEKTGKYLGMTAPKSEFIRFVKDFGYGEGWVKFTVHDKTTVAFIFEAELPEKMVREFKVVLRDLETGEAVDEYEFKIASGTLIHIEVEGKDYYLEYKFASSFAQYFGYVLNTPYSYVYRTSEEKPYIVTDYYIQPAKKGKSVEFVTLGEEIVVSGHFDIPIILPIGYIPSEETNLYAILNTFEFMLIRTEDGGITFPKKVIIKHNGEVLRTYEVKLDSKLGIFWDDEQVDIFQILGTSQKVCSADRACELFPVGYYEVIVKPYEVHKVRIKVTTPSGDPIPIDVGYVAPPYGYLYAWYIGAIANVKNDSTPALAPFYPTWGGEFIAPTVFPAFEFFKVNYLGNGTYEYYLPEGVKVPIFFIYSKPLLDEEGRILALDMPTVYSLTANSKIWFIGYIEAYEDMNVAFTVPLYKLTINVADPELYHKILIVPAYNDIFQLLSTDYKYAVWNCYEKMEKLVQEYLKTISAIEDPKKFINETLNFISERDNWIGVHVAPDFSGGVKIYFKDRELFPLPDATVYRVGNTWYLPPNKYHVYVGGSIKVAEDFSSISVEDGVLVAEVSLYKDAYLNLQLTKEVVEELSITVWDAIGMGVALWLIAGLSSLIASLILFRIYKKRIMKKIEKAVANENQ
ncbi:MAG: hypothetical protein NDF55_08885 [archaeon GB-1867-005]|nr:hypothetical protein [Candidatus Culexmicrobium cathedralense]